MRQVARKSEKKADTDKKKKLSVEARTKLVKKLTVELEELRDLVAKWKAAPSDVNIAAISAEYK